MYNGVMRALETLGLADAFGNSGIPLYVINVTYPLIDAEVERFALGKQAIMIVEEGQPELIEQAVKTILRRPDIGTRVHGKDMMPMAGEYTAAHHARRARRVRRAYGIGIGASRRPIVPSPSAGSRPLVSSKMAKCIRARRLSAPAVRSGRSSPR